MITSLFAFLHSLSSKREDYKESTKKQGKKVKKLLKSP